MLQCWATNGKFVELPSKLLRQNVQNINISRLADTDRDITKYPSSLSSHSGNECKDHRYLSSDVVLYELITYCTKLNGKILTSHHLNINMM